MGLNNAPTSGKYHSGKYNLKNPEKYISDPNNIIYRSSLEFRFCRYADMEPNVIKWGCECLTITYKDKYGKPHRYYPDFYLETLNRETNAYSRIVVEIKPYAETVMPIIPEKITLKKLQSLEYQVKTYEKNVRKWNAATEWCAARGMIFKRVTEKDIAGLYI